MRLKVIVDLEIDFEFLELASTSAVDVGAIPSVGDFVNLPTDQRFLVQRRVYDFEDDLVTVTLEGTIEED